MKIKTNFPDTICERIDLWQRGDNPFVIHEFDTSLFVVGDHQYYRGYSLLLFKDHVREMHELDPATYGIMQEELYIAAKAIYETYKPWKMNYQSLGNQDQHIHWHILPRYEDDPYHKTLPFSASMKGEVNLDDFKVTPDEARSIAKDIKNNLVKLL